MTYPKGQIEPRLSTVKVENRTYSLLVYGDSGPIVFALHGFPDTYHSFRFQATTLVEKGFQLICPCMPGYEISSVNANAKYDTDYLSSELLTVINTWTKDKVHLLGHDWGAIVAYAMVGKSPEKFLTLTNLTIPYNMVITRLPFVAPLQIQYSWYIAFFQLLGIAEWAIERNDFQLIDRLYKNWSPNWQVPPEQLSRIKLVLSQADTKKATLGYYRALASRSSYKYMNEHIMVPTLLLRGEQDGCIAAQTWQIIKPDYFKEGLRICAVDAGHFLHIEEAKQVNDLLIEHLQEYT